MSSSSAEVDDLSLDKLQSRDPAVTKMNTDFFALPGLLPTLNEVIASEDDDGSSRGSRQMCSDSFWGSTECSQQEDIVTNTTDTGPDDLFGLGGVLQRDTWVVPMITFSAVNVIMIITFEVYVICKASRQSAPSRRHLFLGQMLLLGLLLGSLLGFVYALEPTDFSCATIRFGTGLSYALIYSSLLVKLVFLLSLNTGVYLPATYQALLSFFCLLVQLTIGIQWLASSPSSMCDFTTRDHILSLLYVIFLIFFAASLSVKSRHFRDNYRESKYIGGTMAVTVPIWFSWIMASVILHASFHQACVGFGLLVCCAITFIIMFLPKSRQLSAIGKEGIYIEDQDDRFSLHSDRYSPSFYHFKPHKTILSSGHGGVGGGGGSIYKEARPESPYFRAGNSYTGFHRPLRVVPPSATATNSASNHISSHAQQHSPSHPHIHAQPHPHLYPPPPYTSRTSYFPSHFFPEKMYQYWQYYYPSRLLPPGIYSRADLDSMNIYTSLHEQDRTKSVNPNVYFYKTNNYHPGFIY